MNEDPGAIELLRDVSRRLDSLSIPHLVGGSFAASLHGEPRTSVDLDLVIELRMEDIGKLASEFAQDFYSSREAMEEAVRDHRSFNLIHLTSAWKLDFFVRGDSEFDLEEFRRRSAMTLGEPAFEVMVKSPEDSVLRKLQWFRDGGEVAQLQWRDVVGILRHQRGELDEHYLDRWAASLEVADLLTRARREA